MPEVGSFSSSWKSALPSVLLGLFTVLGITALFCYNTLSLDVTNESTSSGSIISSAVGIKFLEKTTKDMTSGLGEYQEMTKEFERQNAHLIKALAESASNSMDELSKKNKEFIKLENEGIRERLPIMTKQEVYLTNMIRAKRFESLGPHRDEFVVRRLDKMPHSVHVFLYHELWNNCAFIFNSPHVIEAGALSASNVQHEKKQYKMEDFEEMGLSSVHFQDYHEDHTHEQ